MKFEESRGQKRQGEDVEFSKAHSEEQHLDADGAGPHNLQGRRSRRDAAAAASEQLQTEEKGMNSSVSSKREVFEMIEESFRHCKRVEDPKFELNACGTTATLNPSRGQDTAKGSPGPRLRRQQSERTENSHNFLH